MLRLSLEIRNGTQWDRSYMIRPVAQLNLEITTRNLCSNLFGNQVYVFQVFCLPAPPAAESVLRCTFSSFQFSALLATGERRI